MERGQTTLDDQGVGPSVDSVANSPRSDDRLHFPGLDGLRGIAVVMVMLFHQGYGWAKGGFIGVSMFFTLSGFLITTLLVAEHRRTGRIAIGAFLARRARRLAPAAVAVALLIAVVWLVVEGNTASPAIGPDLLASLLKASNWWFIVDQQSYGDLFAAPSPYLHYWSLAIEEQLYVLWPLALVAILRIRSHAARVAITACVAVVCASFTFVHDSFDLVYYGTHVRAAELLAGAVLALVVVGRTEQLVAHRHHVSRVLSWVSWLVLAVLVVTAASLGQTSAVWRNGGLAAVGVLSAVVLVGAIVPGALRTSLSHPLLVWLGAWSYGIYLVHWPIFVLVTADRTGLPGWSVFPVRLAATLAAAVLIGRVVEQPIRFRRALAQPIAAAATYAVVVLAGVVAAAFIAIGVADESDGVVASGPQIYVGTAVPGNGGDASGVSAMPTAPPLPPLTVLMVGSTEDAVLPRDDDLSLAFDDARVPGCPLVDAVEVVGAKDARSDLSKCPRPDGWAESLSRAGADAVMITVGPADADRIRITTDGDVLSRLETRAHLLDTLRNAVRDLRGTDVPILLAAEPDLAGVRLESVREILEVVALTDPWVRVVPSPFAEASSAAAVRATLDELLGTDAAADRVLVLGDSTGASLSRLVFEETDGERETVGLAQEGCPLIPVDEIRWWGDVQFDLETCPTIDDIRSYVETFRPSAVLVSSSLMEQAELRVGDSDWFEPTSEQFVVLHDLYMAELQQALADTSLTPIIWVLDSPAVAAGAFGDSPMARPERIAAWNAQIDRWAATWVNVRRLPWSQEIAALEAVEGQIRPDGVHVDERFLRRLTVDFLIPALDDDEAVRQEMRRVGCAPDELPAVADRCRR